MNWKRIVPFAVCCVCAVTAIRKFADTEYIHGMVAALFNLMLGFKGVTRPSEPLSDSEVSYLLADGQDGTGL